LFLHEKYEDCADEGKVNYLEYCEVFWILFEEEAGEWILFCFYVVFFCYGKGLVKVDEP